MIWTIIYTQDGAPSKSPLTIISFEKFSKSPKEKLLEVTTNFQSYQTLFPRFFPSIRIISARPNTILVEEHRIIAGKELVVMARHVIDNNSHETFFVGGDAKGTHLIEKYETIPEGTKITVTIDFKPKMSMKFSSFFNNAKLQNDFELIFDKIIEFAES